MKNEIICPIIISTNIKNKTEILPNVLLSELTPEEKENYFNVLEDEYSMNNLCITTNDPIEPDVFELGYRVALNHKIVLPNQILSNVINALRLYKLSNFGIRYIRGSIHKNYREIPNCLYIPELKIFSDELKFLNDVYQSVCLNSDDKLFQKLMLIYDKVLSFSELSPDEKFRDLVSMLEILYLQGEDRQIKQKLSTRVAYYFNIFWQDDYYKFYTFIKNAYKIRSEIAHNYKSSFDFEQKDNTLFIELLDTVRRSIILYLKNPISYSTDKLKNIPIKFEPS